MKINSTFRLGIIILIFGLVSFSDAPITKWVKQTTVALTPTLRMAKTEVTNNEYHQFINELKLAGKVGLVKKYYPDTTVWFRGVKNDTITDPMIAYYFAHPAFDEYPVVGITYEAAIAFCQWATENKMRYENEQAERKGLKMPPYKIIYRLPTQAEWESAAKLNSPGAVYAGGWTTLKGAKNQDTNGYYFNFRPAKDDYVADGFSFTAPGRGKKAAIIPDKNGFYHLAGNVAEMVSEKGISVGGSWKDFEDKAKIGATNTFYEPNAWTGFRYVIEYIKN